jgi:hypothetical protein
VPDLVASIDPRNTSWIVAVCVSLIGVTVVAFLAVRYYYRRVFGQNEASGAQSWTFEDLKRMKDEGQLTQEEYQALRASLISSFKGHAPKQASPDPSPVGGDFDLEKGRQR